MKHVDANKTDLIYTIIQRREDYVSGYGYPCRVLGHGHGIDEAKRIADMFIGARIIRNGSVEEWAMVGIQYHHAKNAGANWVHPSKREGAGYETHYRDNVVARHISQDAAV